MGKLKQDVATWAKSKSVYTAADPEVEMYQSSSVLLAKDVLYNVMSEITSSTKFSASIMRYTGSTIVDAAHSMLPRIHPGLLASYKRDGSTAPHFDQISGSAVFTSGSVYVIPKGTTHGNSMEVNYKLVEKAFEYKLDEKIALEKGVSAAKNEASASYTGSIDAMKVLPS